MLIMKIKGIFLFSNSIQDPVFFFVVANVQARLLNELVTKTYVTPNAVTAKSIRTQNKGKIELLFPTQKSTCKATIKEETCRRKDWIKLLLKNANNTFSNTFF